MNKTISWLAVILLASLFRDSLFVEINEYLRYLYYNNPTENPEELFSMLSFLIDLGYWPTYWLKWVLTASFILFFYWVTQEALNATFPQVSFKRPVQASYAAGVILSGTFLGLGYLVNDVDSFYTISRKLVGALQSGFIYMILAAIGLVQSRSQK